MNFHPNKRVHLNLGANSSVVPPRGEHGDDKPIDLQKFPKSWSMLGKRWQKLMLDKSNSKRRYLVLRVKNENRVLTSARSIINYNPKAIIQPFLLGDELGSVKKVAENLRVPLLGLGSTCKKINNKVTILFIYACIYFSFISCSNSFRIFTLQPFGN